jgi:hypothetical protein
MFAHREATRLHFVMLLANVELSFWRRLNSPADLMAAGRWVCASRLVPS